MVGWGLEGVWQKAVVQRSPEEQWGSEEATTADVTLLVARSPASCVMVWEGENWWVPVTTFGNQLGVGSETREAAMIVQMGGDRWTRLWALRRLWRDFGGETNRTC